MPFSAILVPLDGHLPSKRALKTAISAAQKLGVPVKLLHIVTLNADVEVAPEFDGVLDEITSAATLREREKLKTLGEEILEGGRQQCEIGGVVCEILDIKYGEAADVILDTSEQLGGLCLIVMGSHGRHGYSRMVLGSVAETVLRGAKCCTMTVRAHDDWGVEGTHAPSTFKKLLLPFDFGELSRHALEAIAIPFAKAFESEITIFHHFKLNTLIPEAMLEKKMRETRDKIDDLILDLIPVVGENRIHVQVSPADDSTADIISKEAHNFDMVIMGTHGRTGLSRLLLGSVCEQVLRQTTTPLCLLNMLVKLHSD